MRVRGLTGDGDWTFGKGQNDYKQGLDATAQNLQTRVSSFLGDCFFAMTQGIDWFNLLGAKNQLAIDLAISSTILNTQDVLSLIELSSVLSQNRKLTTSYKVLAAKGVIQNVISAQTSTSDLVTESGIAITTEDGQRISVETGSAP